MKKIYHNYNKWEDYLNGMYEIGTDISLIDSCEKLLKNKTQLYNAMLSVTLKWEYSSETNLTDTSRNRQAWLGQAACSFLFKAQENLTKEAWHKLNNIEQEKANNIADKIISKWEIDYKNRDQLNLFNENNNA